jgi:hypothetical protein
MGPLGWIASKLFVDQKVKQIFEFRYQTLERYFRQK